MRIPINYRLRQFVWGLWAKIAPAELAPVAVYLPAAAQTLFAQMPLDARRHSLNVLATLAQAGHTNADLAAAALLHDVGKSAVADAGLRFHLWWRGPLVLLEAWTPALLRRLASENVAHGWRYLLHVQLVHPAIGATWAQRAGCSSLTCWLIEHHQDRQPPPAPAESLVLLRALQWADGRN